METTPAAGPRRWHRRLACAIHRVRRSQPEAVCSVRALGETGSIRIAADADAITPSPAYRHVPSDGRYHTTNSLLVDRLALCVRIRDPFVPHLIPRESSLQSSGHIGPDENLEGSLGTAAKR
jgi:hypothetical protein